MFMTSVGEPECLLMGFLTSRAKGAGHVCPGTHTHLGETQARRHTQTRTGCDMRPLPLRSPGWGPVASSYLGSIGARREVGSGTGMWVREHLGDGTPTGRL